MRIKPINSNEAKQVLNEPENSYNLLRLEFRMGVATKERMPELQNDMALQSLEM